MGTETIKPFCAAVRLNASEMNGAIAPFSTQTAKQKSKYKNDANKVGAWPLFKKVPKPLLDEVLFLLLELEGDRDMIYLLCCGG